MNFMWSAFLYLLLLIPLIVAVYVWLLRRRRRFAIRYSSLSLVREAMSHQSWLRRHLPFILFLFALAGLVFALARPVAMVSVPSNRATIILAVDVSRSMCSTDIAPNRLEAAKNAALAFIKKQDRSQRIGVVAFAGFAELVQPPTDNRSLLENALNNLTPGRRTAIGSAILQSLDAIAEIDSHVAPSDIGSTSNSSSVVTPVPEGQYVPHIIVLLTDGSSNAGPNPYSAAQQAADRGVRVYTIGFGTVNNSSAMNCGNPFQSGDQFGGGFNPFGGGGGGFRRGIDEATLNAIADTTGGKYYTASSAGELNSVFQDLPSYLVVTQQETEIGAYFTAFAALLAVIAMILSFRWHPLS
jgi:Ca-activated chloride channel homolog